MKTPQTEKRGPVPLEELNRKEAIALAVYEEMVRTGIQKLTKSQLIVVVWKKFPHVFGLKEFEEQYPDANAVIVDLSGEKGMLQRHQWIAKVEQGIYALTKKGNKAVQSLLLGKHPKVPALGKHAPAPDEDVELAELPAPKQKTPEKAEVNLDPRIVQQVVTLLESNAHKKAKENDRDRMPTLPEAMRFWGIDNPGQFQQIPAKIESAQLFIDELRKFIGEGHCVTENGRDISSDEVEALQTTHDSLQRAFVLRISQIRNRQSQAEASA